NGHDVRAADGGNAAHVVNNHGGGGGMVSKQLLLVAGERLHRAGKRQVSDGDARFGVEHFARAEGNRTVQGNGVDVVGKLGQEHRRVGGGDLLQLVENPPLGRVEKDGCIQRIATLHGTGGQSSERVDRDRGAHDR